MPELQAGNWDKNGNETSHLVPARGKWELPLETMLLPLIGGTALRALVSIYFLEFWEMPGEFNTHDAGG